MATTTRRLQPPTPRVALLLVAAVVVAVVLYLGREALTPFLLGLLVIYVMDPAVGWFQRRGIPRGVAVLLVYVLVFGTLIVAVSLLLRPLVAQVTGFIGDLPRFNQAIDNALRQMQDVYAGLQLPPAIRSAIDRAFQDLGQTAGAFDVRSLLPIATTIAGALGALFGYLIVPVWAFYLLKDRERLLSSFDQALPEPWRRDTWAVLRIIERIFGRWLRAQIVLGLVVGAATFVGLLVLGSVIDQRFTQFAILLAVIAGLFELLPIIGPILSMIPSLLVGLTVSPQAVVAVVLLYLLVQQLENNILVPKIQGGAIELHASVVIFALIIGGAIAGLLGAILALPITAAGKEIYRYLFRRLSEVEEVSVTEPTRPLAPQPAIAPGPALDIREEGTETSSVGRESEATPASPTLPSTVPDPTPARAASRTAEPDDHETVTPEPDRGAARTTPRALPASRSDA